MLRRQKTEEGNFYRFIRLVAFWLAWSMRDTLRVACREREMKAEMKAGAPQVRVPACVGLLSLKGCGFQSAQSLGEDGWLPW